MIAGSSYVQQGNNPIPGHHTYLFQSLIQLDEQIYNTPQTLFVNTVPNPRRTLSDFSRPTLSSTLKFPASNFFQNQVGLLPEFDPSYVRVPTETVV